MSTIQDLRSKKIQASHKKSTLLLSLTGVVVVCTACIISIHFAMMASQSKLGDLNHDGVIDAKDAAILAGNREDKTVVEKESPKAQTSAPVKIVSKPIILVQ